jgi:hypothetical protein
MSQSFLALLSKLQGEKCLTHVDTEGFTPGLMRRLTLHVGHLTLASLILFSLGIGVNPLGDLIRHLSGMVSPLWAHFPP